ncbi:hypothetical protein JFT60_01595 [Pseudomonas sp. MF6772]|uniref:hypothetical protein n=1 Tax=Pseudomonas TaxID=286 RepID=UPI000ABC53EA|nr:MULTISPECIES: hypothetical protein [Pseudomonas]MBJ2266051.1 hypothetical protein [Pseudomonas sp. MF6772]MBL7226855.1 hypothetical protein [Pseudomonas sp.]MCM8560764.1 hypothetical protein [Pseudomonas shahriarae]MCU0210743.1 hypothetical protein [Pseudomonas shahriarae]NMY19457.1 hypothetical protein [Pseudomonas sp. WS 5410]
MFPSPYPKAEESRDWEMGVNVFKEGLFFNDDRLGICGYNPAFEAVPVVTSL